ncbi:MAG: hypothetical protein EXR79_12400 [Myxococcales bacterium]|nr:hypothetical protein [Myxococcales bacterium]
MAAVTAPVPTGAHPGTARARHVALFATATAALAACGGGGSAPTAAAALAGLDGAGTLDGARLPDGAVALPADASAAAAVPVGGGAGVHAALCAAARFRSALRSNGPTDALDLPKLATALELAGFEVVRHLAGSTEATAPLGDQPWVAGSDTLHDTVFAFANGTLVAASRCPLDRLGQVRRLDLALAQAVQVWAQVASADWKVAAARWSLPTAIYGEHPGAYQRRYLPDTADLNKAQQGTLSLSAAAPAVFALYGQTDAPSAAGDVITLDALEIGTTKVAGPAKHAVQGPVALAWSLGTLPAGESSWAVKLLVADAGLEWKVGSYRGFVDALLPNGKGALAWTVQGALPGPARVERDVAELGLPGSVTGSAP